MSVTPGMREFGGLGDRIKTLESKVSKLELQRRLQSASIGSGGLRIKDGGKLTVLDGSDNVLAEFDVDGVEIFEADGSTLVTLDGTGIRLNDGSGTKLIDLTTSGLQAYEADGSTLLTLDGSKLRFNRSDGTRSLEITPGGGLKIYDTNGTTEKVVLDSTGLDVDGGNVVATYTDVKEAGSVGGQTLTNTMTELESATFTVPSWVVSAKVFAIGTIAGTSTSGVSPVVSASCRIEDVDDGFYSVHFQDTSRTQVVHLDESVLDTSVDKTVKISIYGKHNATSPDDDFTVEPNAWGILIGYAT